MWGLAWEVTHVGHDEPLLGLVRGPRVLLAKAQTDLVLGLRVTILQVGLQLCGHRLWTSHLVPTLRSYPTPMSYEPTSPLCTPMPCAHFHMFHVPHPCPFPVLTPHVLCS